MDVKEKIRAYIERTDMRDEQISRYDMGEDYMFRLADLSGTDKTMAVLLAFLYGRAKGYRAAKASLKNRKV